MKKEVALYQKIINDILDDIQLGKYDYDSKLETEEEISIKYNVSRATVSKAMNELKNNGTITRYAGRGTYVNLKNSTVENGTNENGEKTLKHVAVLIPSITDKFGLSILEGITKHLKPGEFQITLVSTKDYNGESIAIKRQIKAGISGLILFPVDQEFYSDEILKLKLNRFPMVLIDRPFPGIDTNSITFNNESGGRLAIDHLASYNHKNIAFITTADKSTFTIKKRISAYKKYISKSENEINLHVVDNFSFSNKSNARDILYNLVTKKKVSGIIVSESPCALPIYSILNSMSISVPEDVSIITYDAPLSNIKEFEFFTHVCQNPATMGEMAGEIIYNILTQNIATEPTQKKLIEPALVICKSTRKI